MRISDWSSDVCSSDLLIKIIAVLMQDFGFTPQSDWVEHVVAFSAQSRAPRDNSFTIKFTRDHPGMTATLDVDPVLANGRRPDSRLRSNVSASAAALEMAFRQYIFGHLSKQHPPP